MVPSTRRALLHGAAGLATALAGCSALADDSPDSTSTVPRDDSDRGPGSGSEIDPETLTLRVAADRPPIWLAKPNGEGDGRPTASGRDRWRESLVVDDSVRADRIDVAATVDGARVESFLEATEFGAETVYVEMVTVEECFRLDLCVVSWSPSEISTDYTRRSRPYTERCAVDERVVEARLIRIPDAMEADDVNGYSSSVGGGACGRRHGRAEGERESEASASASSPRTQTQTTASGGGD
jgi:hypothetical protein